MRIQKLIELDISLFIIVYFVMLFWLNYYISKAFKYILLYLFIVIVRPAGLELLGYLIEF